MTYQAKPSKRKTGIGRKRLHEAKKEMIFSYWFCGGEYSRKHCPHGQKKKESSPYKPQGHESIMQDAEKEEGEFP